MLKKHKLCISESSNWIWALSDSRAQQNTSRGQVCTVNNNTVIDISPFTIAYAVNNQILYLYLVKIVKD